MLKTVLKLEDVVKITFWDSSFERKLAQISSCETCEGNLWSATLTITGDGIPGDTHEVVGNGVIELDAIDDAIAKAMEFLQSTFQCGFVQGRFNNKPFTKDDVRSEQPIMT